MPFQILCLSGGGYLGLYSATIIAELEAEFGGPLARHFDLIAGTSIGGIIALALANEVPAESIKSCFERSGTKIFSGRAAPSGVISNLSEMGRALFSSKYADCGLRSAIQELLPPEILIGNLRHPCLVPSVNLSKGGPQVFKTDHHPDFRRDLFLKSSDVAMATSAAPTYFPVAKVGDALYADGGLFANSPDWIAIHEAEHFFGKKIDEIHVLSIGTTTAKFSFSHTSSRAMGIAQWAYGARLIQTIISSQQQLVDHMVTHRLGSRYIRLDVSQSKEQQQNLGLDVANADAQSTIRALASATAQSAISRQELRQIFAYIAPQPVFYHRREMGGDR